MAFQNVLYIFKVSKTITSMDKESKELYDDICKVLTWYECSDESPLTADELEDEMYDLLVRTTKFLSDYADK